MPRFFLDEDLPRSLNFLLQQRGHSSEHIVDLGLRGASDKTVFALALEKGAILVSRDLGFANILDYSLGSHHGIVVVRFPSEIRTAVLLDQVVLLLESIEDSEFAGALIILDPARIRIRGPQK